MTMKLEQLITSLGYVVLQVVIDLHLRMFEMVDDGVVAFIWDHWRRTLSICVLGCIGVHVYFVCFHLAGFQIWFKIGLLPWVFIQVTWFLIAIILENVILGGHKLQLLIAPWYCWHLVWSMFWCIFCFIKPLKNVSRTLIAIAIINVTLPGNNLCDKLTYYPLLIFNDHKNMISKYIYYWSHTSRKQRVWQTYHLSDTNSEKQTLFLYFKKLSDTNSQRQTLFLYCKTFIN